MEKKHALRFALGSIATVFVIACCGAALERSGWPTSLPFIPSQPSAAQMVDEFEAASGPHPGFRRNHAKGICITGQFESNGTAAEVSRASFFKSGVFPVVGRLSVVGGNPAINDARGRLRSLALEMKSSSETWKTAMNSIPVFFVNTPQGVFDQLRASVPDKDTGRPDPRKMEAFRREHPEIQPFEDWMNSHPPATGFDNAAYFSVNAFRFITDDGQVRNVRWRMIPETPYAPITDAQMRGDDPDMLSYGLAKRLAQGPVRWHLLITLGEPGDSTTDATRQWPDEQRRQIDAGVLVIDRQQSQIDGPCRDIDFNPLVLPSGIEPSDDPLLLARGAAYEESRRRRVQEVTGHAPQLPANTDTPAHP